MTFSHKDYIPLDYLWIEAFNEAYDAAAEFLYKTAKHPMHFMMNRTEDVCFSWFEEFYFKNLFISDQNMNPIRMNGWVLRENRWYVDISGLKSELILGEELCQKYSLCEPLAKEDLEHIENLYEKGNEDGIEKWWEAFKLKTIDDLNQTRPPLFINQINFSIDLSLFDFWHENENDTENYYNLDTKLKAESLRQFQGAFLSIPKSLYDEKWTSHWSNILERKLEDNSKLEYEIQNGPNALYENDGRHGRPRKQEKALLAYRSQFPSGHGQTPWKEVIREIENKAGLSVSVDTLRRAIKNGSQN